MQSATYLVSDAMRNELRSATRELHARLDRHPVLSPLVRPNLSSELYALALNALYVINQPVEQRLAEFVMDQRLPLDFQSYERMPDLAADLQALGWPVPEPIWLGPRLASIGDFVGNMYVLTGSALGGQLIFRQVQVSLPAAATVGGRYFAGYGPSTAERWQGFLEFAASSCQRADLEDACRAARRLFQDMLLMLDDLPSFHHSNT